MNGTSALAQSGNFLPTAMDGMVRWRGILGYAVILGLCFLLCNNKKRIAWRTVILGLALQFACALLVFSPGVSHFFFTTVDHGVNQLIGFANAGINFLFQSTMPHQASFIGDGGQVVTETFVGRMSPVLKCFAFSILPTIIFFSSLITLLYYLGVMQVVVNLMARAMTYVLKTSGAETLSTAANVFVGQTEAPLVVRPFIDKMTESEIFTIMVSGFAHVAGGVLAIYVGILHDVPGIAGHLVTASLMAAPCSLAISKFIFPEVGAPDTAGSVKIEMERTDRNMIEAAARGATDGIFLALNIGAVLLSFVGLVALTNGILGLAGISLEQILSWIFAPLCWVMGVPWGESQVLGMLLGKKLVLTEMVAYMDLRNVIHGSTPLISQRTAVIASYALCGFANFASIGIQIGGIGSMAPNRRGDLARFGLKAMVAGALVSCLSGTIAGLLVA